MQVITEEIGKRLPLTAESKRLFHGRGHCYPGYEDLLIDWFKPVVLISLYAPRDEAWLQELLVLLQKTLSAQPAVLLQQRYIPNSSLRLLTGELPQNVSAIEGGLQYRLRLGAAQNIGFFLDMAVGRKLVREQAADKRVLNLFSYTCSFSVAALAGGAAQVVNLDMNRGALNLGRLNHQLNHLDLRQVSFLPLELFRSFGKLKRLGPFDLLICDPPADQGENFNAKRDWPKLLRRLPDLLSPGGQLLACLNGPHLPPEFLLELIRDIRPELELLQQLQPGADFPEADAGRGGWIFYYRDRSG